MMRMHSNQSSELRQGSIAPGFYLSASNDDPNQSSYFAARNLQPRQFQEIAASPIYSESGGAPGRKFYMNIGMKQHGGNFLT